MAEAASAGGQASDGAAPATPAAAPSASPLTAAPGGAAATTTTTTPGAGAKSEPAAPEKSNNTSKVKDSKEDGHDEGRDGGEGEEDGERSGADELAGPAVVIDPSKDLWQNIAANVRDANAEQLETNLLIVGASGSGKTTLLQRIYSTAADSANTGSSSNSGGGGGGGGRKVRPTTALDYSFARRTDRNVTQIAHLWELAQGIELAQLSEIVITAENLHTIVVAVVVDASEGGLAVAWESATYWLRRIDRRVAEVAQKMRAKNSSTPDKLLARARRVIGADHPDLDRLRLSGLPTVLVINKLDKLAGLESTKVRLLVRTMRFLAHLYGAHIIFTNEQESYKWRALMSHLLFQLPFDPRYVQFDPERGGVLLTPDKDSFAAIGEPDATLATSAAARDAGYAGATGDAELDRWKAPFDATFPPAPLPTSDAMLDNPFLNKLYDTSEGGFGEPAIDALRKQKDEELEQYRRNKSRENK